MVATQRDELFANWTASVRFSLALPCMGDDTLHLLTRRRSAVGIATLTSMYQALDASSDGILSVVVRIRLAVSVTSVQVEAEFLHSVGMPVFAEALDAKVEVVANGAMVACLDTLGTVVAGVDKLVLTLSVELVEKYHRRILHPSQRRKFEMFLSGHRQEGVTTVHHVTGHRTVRVRDRSQVCRGLGRVESDGEEDLLVFLHGHKHLLCQVSPSTLCYFLLIIFPLRGRRFLLLHVFLFPAFLAVGRRLVDLVVNSVVCSGSLGCGKSLLLFHFFLPGLLFLKSQIRKKTISVTSIRYRKGLKYNETITEPEALR